MAKSILYQNGTEIGKIDLLPETEIVALSLEIGPSRCGIYFLIQDCRLMYVGQSVNIDARIAQHRRERKFDRYHWIACAPEKLDALERAYLDRFLPPWNTDSRTVTLRGDRRRAMGFPDTMPPPASKITFDSLKPENWTPEQREIIEEEKREAAEWAATHWTQHDVRHEWMRRIRQMRYPSRLKPEDFGPMPDIGDPKDALKQ